MKDYIYWNQNPDELYHYGRKGMKWGKHIFGIGDLVNRNLNTAKNEANVKLSDARDRYGVKKGDIDNLDSTYYLRLRNNAKTQAQRNIYDKMYKKMLAKEQAERNKKASATKSYEEGAGRYTIGDAYGEAPQLKSALSNNVFIKTMNANMKKLYDKVANTRLSAIQEEHFRLKGVIRGYRE